jgi:hypothetical protein
MALKGFNTKLNWTIPKVFNRHKPASGKQVADTIFYVGNAKSWAPDIHKGIEDSSWVKSIDYDESKQLLTVTFRDGFTAHYPKITKDEATAFVEDESKGRYVWKVLYNRKYY